MRNGVWFWIFLFECLTSGLQAAVLPNDRADILFHSFDGGGVEITGPSILVRKKFGESLSFSANHYVDNVSSASIDVLTSASPYDEKRDENSFAVDFLNNSTTMSLAMTKSTESDFDASTVSVNFSQDMFADLTTIDMGFSRGDNTVRRNGDSSFSKESNSRSYRLSVSQILSKNMIMSLALEGIADEGFLNNPYRSVRFFDAGTPSQFSFQSEVYPGTKTSTAVAWRTRYFLSGRSVLSGGYRIYSDSWGIDAKTIDFGYTWPYRNNWIIDTSLRYYTQTQADFYNDLFPFQNAQNFLARDKELSTFTSVTLGAGISYKFDNKAWSVIKRGSVNLYLDYIQFDYDNFRDLTQAGSVGNEPLYSFDAQVIRVFASFWF